MMNTLPRPVELSHEDAGQLFLNRRILKRKLISLSRFHRIASVAFMDF